MAGTSVRFNAARTRARLRAAMAMGMPADVDQQLHWHWRREQSFVPDDPAGQPYDWGVLPVTDSPGNPEVPTGSLVVPYALEVLGRDTALTTVGGIDITRALVTVLDEEWAQVQGADYCSIGVVRYDIEVLPPQLGLYDLTVIQVMIRAAAARPT